MAEQDLQVKIEDGTDDHAPRAKVQEVVIAQPTTLEPKSSRRAVQLLLCTRFSHSSPHNPETSFPQTWQGNARPSEAKRSRRVLDVEQARQAGVTDLDCVVVESLQEPEKLRLDEGI